MSYKFPLLMWLCLFGTQLYAKPTIIAHRGASGYLPEHTIEAAVLAFSQGADFIEQDLVLSKDLIPVVLHDIHLETVTNVEQVFPKRHRTDGRYYAFDFTLEELQTLNVHERTTQKGEQVYPQRYHGQSPFKIATFEQQINLIQQLNRQFKRNVGLYVEIKSPRWHQKNGADLSQITLNILRKHGLDNQDSHVYVQCFDFAETQRLSTELQAKVKLIQLIAENSWQESESDYDYLKTSEGLKAIAKVAQGIGPWIPQVFNFQHNRPTTLVANAHKAGLLVHPYTFRKDELPKEYSSQQTLEILFEQLKVDGLFTDFTDEVKSYIDKQVNEVKPKG
ncbi:glycerophosphodiester phosphodiesterase [Aliiglaciecola sp. 3_MG-2023]|uniref:glycerophosphodiester phosphodiesterase n=1 Tax=Aliiglaciecola sp. 3_MG-2023 TaxID=3062644 RepID=UPI0026E429EE|nr:glycerophosphodiester phosphodiesterase [Aliiglaciecola sp. 3_MG-2023]MDO6695297.1 glycerophosphodiester phosphodiesterase [Aliiglaciecola sp. 3_MG-2023]